MGHGVMTLATSGAKSTSRGSRLVAEAADAGAGAGAEGDAALEGGPHEAG